MIHLNVPFLVIRPTLSTIVKILINACSLVVNKYTSNGLFMHVLYYYNMVAGMHDVHCIFNRRA